METGETPILRSYDFKIRQGVGRLIRTKTDQGIIVALDNRILTKQYGQAFIDALPKCPLEVVA